MAAVADPAVWMLTTHGTRSTNRAPLGGMRWNQRQHPQIAQRSQALNGPGAGEAATNDLLAASTSAKVSRPE
jgi:hypothetical protein